MPFITLRNRTDENDPAKHFGEDRGTLRAGHCSVLRRELTPLKPIVENAPFYVPDNVAKLESITERPVAQLLDELRAGAGDRRPVLYTHGYYIDFERGCKRASIFQDSLGLDGRFVLFSWPSDGAILNYTRDEADLYWSVTPLAEVLANMIERFGAGRMDVVAHSLGTRGVFLALVELADREHDDEPIVGQLVLVAPDIDLGLFEQQLHRIRPLAGRITVYVSSNDQPLALSREVHGYPRLGEAGPRLARLAGVEIVDISELPVRYPSGHVYHLYHKRVIEDLSELLNAGKSASARAGLSRVGTNRWLMQP